MPSHKAPHAPDCEARCARIEAALVAADRRLELAVTQAQSLKMEAVARMAGGIGHDYNNMLTVILAALDVAESASGADPELADSLAAIRQATERSVEFTRQLLAFARKRTAAPRAVDAAGVLTQAAKMLRRLVAEPVTLELPAEGSLHALSLDPGRLDQVLANLLVNGRDPAWGLGPVVLRARNVTLGPADAPAGLPPGQHVCIELIDADCHPPPDAGARRFEAVHTRAPTGHALPFGLEAVPELVDEMGGAVMAQGGPTGTVFTLYLPRHVDGGTLSGLAPTPAPLRGAPTPHEAATILLVEDDAAALAAVADLLRRGGYETLTAATPTAAMALFKARQGRIDLLVTDVILPTQDGDQLARQLLALRRDLPVLYMSGYPPDILADRLATTPGAGFLSKPFTPTMLMAQVRRLLERRRRPRG